MKKTQPPKEYIVSFLDILGYSEIISEAKPDRTRDLFEAVSEMVGNAEKIAQRLLGGPEEVGWEKTLIEDTLGYRAFSDNIVVFCGLHPNSNNIADNKDNYLAIGLILLIQAWIQSKLLIEYHLLSRGGVAIGPFSEEEDFLFGKALVDAYNLEEAAETPRIIIDRRVRDVFWESSRKAGCKFKEKDLDAVFRRDVDGEMYIPYLVADVYVEKLLSDERKMPDYEKLLDDHCHSLESAIVENEKAIRKSRKTKHKYIWTARYHNEEAEKIGSKNLIDLQRLYDMDESRSTRRLFPSGLRWSKILFPESKKADHP